MEAEGTPERPPGVSPPTDQDRVWHYAVEGAAFGPVDASELFELSSRGVIDAGDLVWREGWAQWRRIDGVSELSGIVPAPSGLDPGNLNADPERHDSIRPPVRVSAPTARVLRLFALRVAAALIDQLVLFVPSCLGAAPVVMVMIARGATFDTLSRLGPSDSEYWILMLVTWGIHWVYASLMESSGWMGTLGKRACGLVAVRGDGVRLSFGRASARYWCKLLSVQFALGYLASLLLGGERCVHDVLAGSRVSERGRR